MKNLAQQVKRVQEPAEPSLSTKQVGDNYPHSGLKEAPNEASKLLIRTQLQVLHGDS